MAEYYFMAALVCSQMRQMAILLLLVLAAACHPEEKNKRAEEQASDTLSKVTKSGAADTSFKSPVFPGVDAFQQGCEFIQEQAEALLEEYYQKKTAVNRRKRIISELEKLEQEWKKKDCQQVFGFMLPEIPRSTHRTGANSLDK